MGHQMLCIEISRVIAQFEGFGRSDSREMFLIVLPQVKLIQCLLYMFVDLNEIW